MFSNNIIFLGYESPTWMVEITKKDKDECKGKVINGNWNCTIIPMDIKNKFDFIVDKL